MSTQTLGDRYFEWLCEEAGTVKSRGKVMSYRKLFEQLHETIFVAIVPHDDNRIAEARDMRYEFLAEHEDEQGSPEWMRLPCSMLELMIVLARRLSFQTDDEVTLWFWHLINELDLEHYPDRRYNDRAREEISEILDRVIWRNYEPNGHGGFFPLERPLKDQREVELWYQLNSYLLELY